MTKRIHPADLRSVYLADRNRFANAIYRDPPPPNQIEPRAERRGKVIMIDKDSVGLDRKV
jgi:hypothetical protein